MFAGETRTHPKRLMDGIGEESSKT